MHLVSHYLFLWWNVHVRFSNFAVVCSCRCCDRHYLFYICILFFSTNQLNNNIISTKYTLLMENQICSNKGVNPDAKGYNWQTLNLLFIFENLFRMILYYLWNYYFKRIIIKCSFKFAQMVAPDAKIWQQQRQLGLL